MLPMRKNKQVIGSMKDELGGQIMEKFVGLRAKTYCCLKDDDEYKKAKGTKKFVIKRNLKFRDYKKCLKCMFKKHKQDYEHSYSQSLFVIRFVFIIGKVRCFFKIKRSYKIVTLKILNMLLLFNKILSLKHKQVN